MQNENVFIYDRVIFLDGDLWGTMKNFVYFLIIFISGYAFAGPCSGQWNVSCSAGKTDSVSATGYLQMNGTTVKKGVNVNGRATAKNSTMDSINVNGQAKLKHSIVNHDATVDGKLSLSNSTIKGDTHVMGETDMKKSHIHGKLNLIGFLDMDQSKVDGPILILSDEAKLNKSIIADITFQKSNSFWKETEELNLTSSIVKGNITFKNGKGIIHLDKTSKILGKVTGGKIVHGRATED